MTKTYDTRFHQYAANTSQRAAHRISHILRTMLPISSVLDVGCAYGTWLRAWRVEGVEDVFGVDGPWVDLERLEIPADRFRSHDLGQRLDLGRRFDLVESLEVAEHLPGSRAATFVDSLTAHGDVVLFSAAPPGQGGEHHVNEQPYDYWRSLFHQRGFVGLDCIRPLLTGDTTVSPWYRYNVFLYMRPAAMARLPEYARQFQLEEGVAVRDVAPWIYQLRRRIVRRLPRAVQNGLARALAHRYSDPNGPVQDRA